MILLLLPAAALLTAGPWWLRSLFVVPVLLWTPGWGLARALTRAGDRAGHSRLQRALDAAWIGMALTWLDVALVRELGLTGDSARWALWGLALLWAGLGEGAARRSPPAPPSPVPTRERLGVALVLTAVIGVGVWRQADVLRPLDGYWYVTGAESASAAPLRLLPERGWLSHSEEGWPEAAAAVLVPGEPPHTLTAPDGAQGRAVFATRGPVGATIRVGEQQATVARSMTEEPAEGPVRRYLDRGTVGVVVDLDLAPGESLEIETDGETVYALGSSEAVWALHATGELRYVHYYQLLNIVENQVWADEVRESRRFTWNQPPGWSPLLSAAGLVSMRDLPASNLLFLQVLVLLGCTAVRAASLLAPAAPLVAFAVPAGMIASHGLLMLEPMSANFPDNLYAASVLAVVTTLLMGRRRAFGALGTAAQALRWPGGVMSLLLAGAWWRGTGARAGRPVALLLIGLIAGMAVAAVAMVTGDAEDLLFILYFETFPEHWHGEFSPSELLPRVPGFYGLWLAYTGGGLALAALGAFAHPSPTRRRLRALGGATFAYSLLLATIDHHPTHYFLPLVALTGPLVVASSAAVRQRWLRLAIPLLCLLGLALFLHRGQV